METEIGQTLMGPIGGLLAQAAGAATSNAGEELRTPAERVGKFAITRIPALRFIDALDKLYSGDYDFRDPAGRLRMRGNLKAVLMNAASVRGMDEADLNRVLDSNLDIGVSYLEHKDRVVKALVSAEKARQEKDPGRAKDMEEVANKTLADWRKLFPEIPFQVEEIDSAVKADLKKSGLTMPERIAKGQPKELRPLWKPIVSKETKDEWEKIERKDILPTLIRLYARGGPSAEYWAMLEKVSPTGSLGPVLEKHGLTGTEFLQRADAVKKADGYKWIEATPAFAPLLSKMEARLKRLSPTELRGITPEDTEDILSEWWEDDEPMKAAIAGALRGRIENLDKYGLEPLDLVKLALRRARGEIPYREAAD